MVQFLLDYVAKEPVERILVGLPKQMNNEASENMKNIEPFVRSLKKKLPDMPVEYVDERFTSVLAHRTMLEACLLYTSAFPLSGRCFMASEQSGSDMASFVFF